MTRSYRAFTIWILAFTVSIGLVACESEGLNPSADSASNSSEAPSTPTVPTPVPPTGFAWVNGSNTISSTGTYGSRGLTGALNTPAARSGANVWHDKANRRTWLFGGSVDNGLGFVTNVNDLWVFDETTTRWTWIDGASGSTSSAYGTRGTASPTNRPPGRASGVTWMDSSGNLWLFGGAGTTGRYNDTWIYQPNLAQWTWMNGSTTVNQYGVYNTLGVPTASTTPGARFGSVSWMDSSANVWLLGGLGFGTSGAEGMLNDLWVLDSATHRWTWVAGPATPGALGTYGTKGVAAAPNYPGARQYANAWVDHAGIFWLFGGKGYGSGAYGSLNDVWSFDPSTGWWTWQAGQPTVNQPSVPGTLGVEDATTTPGATAMGSATWTDADGKLWFFGGEVADTASTPAIARSNDFWRFNPTTKHWSKVYAGNQSATGVYGTKGTPSLSNVIGSREGAIGWFDVDGTAWIFGGNAFDVNGASGLTNDLWKVVR